MLLFHLFLTSTIVSILARVCCACNTTSCDISDPYCCEVDDIHGISVIATPKSYTSLPRALDVAALTVNYITSSFASSIYRDALAANNHRVYVYHGDPTISTGSGLDAKSAEYDYVSDIYNLSGFTQDGSRPIDNVYGLGGTLTGPTTILDCNLLPECTDDLYGAESILHHEFGHAIQNIAVRLGNNTLWDEIKTQVYTQYITNVSGASSKYCGYNELEMFACSVQVYLMGTKRTDTTLGIETVANIQTNVPLLYDVLYQLFGESVQQKVYGMSDVAKIPRDPDWNFYDLYINQYGDDGVRAHWNSIKYTTGSPTSAPTTDVVESTDAPTIGPTATTAVQEDTDSTHDNDVGSGVKQVDVRNAITVPIMIMCSMLSL